MHTTDTQTRIEEIAEELRQLYNNDNYAPRLIKEMLEEFVYPRGEDEKGMPMSHNLG